MSVITMTQEMATLGKDVALGVCEALGLEQVRHEVGDVVAGKMHVKKSLILDFYRRRAVRSRRARQRADSRLGRHAMAAAGCPHPKHQGLLTDAAADQAPDGAARDRR